MDSYVARFTPFGFKFKLPTTDNVAPIMATVIEHSFSGQ